MAFVRPSVQSVLSGVLTLTSRQMNSSKCPLSSKTSFLDISDAVKYVNYFQHISGFVAILKKINQEKIE